MNKEILGLIAGGILLLAYGMYIYTMWWGKTRPSRSSWWILTVVWGVILLSSMSFNPDKNFIDMTSFWITIASILGSLTVAISSLWRGSNKKEENWTKYDTRSALCAGVALALYFIFHRPEVSFIFAILADFSGLFPTIENAKNYPDQEDLTAWIITVASCIVGVIAVPDWGLSFQSASNWAIPVYLVIVDSIVVFFIVRRFFAKKKPI